MGGLNIADDMAVDRIAPSPAASDIEQGEVVTCLQLPTFGSIALGGIAQNCTRYHLPIGRFGIMGCKVMLSFCNIGKVGTDGLTGRVKRPGMTRQAETDAVSRPLCAGRTPRGVG